MKKPTLVGGFHQIFFKHPQVKLDHLTISPQVLKVRIKKCLKHPHPFQGKLHFRTPPVPKYRLRGPPGF